MGENRTMSDVVIRVEHLCKEYRLGTISHGTLYRDLQSGWAKFRGKEDPNARIGSINAGQLNKTNDRFCALKEVSFDIRQGETVGIIGRNGAGKSTLLKIISRVTAPTHGTIKIKGRVASLLEVKRFSPGTYRRGEYFSERCNPGNAQVGNRTKI